MCSSHTNKPGLQDRTFSEKKNPNESASELFNASYQVLLQVLIRYFIHGTESDEELTTLSNVAVDTMFLLIKPLGELLTRLPVGPSCRVRWRVRASRCTGRATSCRTAMGPGWYSTSGCSNWRRTVIDSSSGQGHRKSLQRSARVHAS